MTVPPAVDFTGIAAWIIERGLRGLPLDEQLAGFANRISAAGFPMRRVGMGMGTLHPRYGALMYVWRPDSDRVEYSPRERSARSLEEFRDSPVNYMIETEQHQLRRRLDGNEPLQFPILEEFRAAGMTDYAARLVEFGPAAPETEAERTAAGRGALEGVFFSCATDQLGGFDPAALQQVGDLLPFLAMAIKSRLTYEVARIITETYLGKDAGGRVLTGEIERGSTQTIQSVIWLCDLRGFTQLADTLPRDDLIALLDDYLDVMARPVHDNHGQVLKFLGDGFLATFDLTGLDGPGVCRSALAAAADLRTTFAAFNRQRRSAGKPVLDFGLSLHLGDVFYGNIGAIDRLDFTVVGPAVNEASRIEDLCRPLGRDILVSGAFHAVAQGSQAQLDSVGTHTLRGVRAPQELFTLAP